MKVFLAGATGAIGRRVLPRLISAGHEVTAMVRSAAGAETVERAGAASVLADAMDAGAVRAAVVSASPDVVMHQLTSLATSDFAANSRLRIHASRHLADAAEQAGVRRFIAQSICWIYEPGEGPADEDTPLDLDAPDPRKFMVGAVAELEAQAARSPEWVVLRYGMLYGPDTWYSPTGDMADRARRGDLPATADVTSFVHVDDAAAAAIQALTWPSGAFNLCDDEPAAGSAWVPAFCAEVGAPPPPSASAERTGFARGADNSRARRTLGWTPRWTTWREGFTELKSDA